MEPREFKAWMKQRRMTQAQTADALGLSASAVAQMARGVTPIKRRHRLMLLGLDAEKMCKMC
jgi:transcriptional regulator with XRE-family HTH domain